MVKEHKSREFNFKKEDKINDDKFTEYKVKEYKNSDDEFMGVTIKGKSKDFLKAHGQLRQMMIKGKEYNFENATIKILDHIVMKNMTVSKIKVK